jgi:hypothetical protein
MLTSRRLVSTKLLVTNVQGYQITFPGTRTIAGKASEASYPLLRTELRVEEPDKPTETAKSNELRIKKAVKYLDIGVIDKSQEGSEKTAI